MLNSFTAQGKWLWLVLLYALYPSLFLLYFSRSETYAFPPRKARDSKKNAIFAVRYVIKHKEKQ